jgi:cytochrome c oxidase subunit II
MALNTMNIFNSILLAFPDEALRDRVRAKSLDGTEIPDSVLTESGGSAFWSSRYWFPESASTFAPQVDFLYMGIFWISAFFFVGIVATMVYFVFKYRRIGNEINPLPSPSHHTGIEVLWSVLPSILLAWMFFEGVNGYFSMRAPIEVEEEIQVKASQFNWEFTYPDGDKSNELHLVLDRPTQLVMYSTDVLHSLYVPAFRQKMDVVPGRYTYFYINPNKPGTFRLTCTEYCGNEHSQMKTIAKVHLSHEDRKASTEWIRAEHAPWEYGKRLYQINCSGCHRVDGAAATGPPLNNTWGDRERRLADGLTIPIDYDYIRRSIYEPESQIVEGYSNKMPSFKGRLKEEDVNAIIQYLKYLNDPASVSNDPIGDNPITPNGASEGQETPADQPPATGDTGVTPAAGKTGETTPETTPDASSNDSSAPQANPSTEEKRD